MRSSVRGTPNKLSKAIANGIEDYEDDQDADSIPELIEKIRATVEEFTRNKLGPILGLADNASDVEKYVKRFIDSLD